MEFMKKRELKDIRRDIKVMYLLLIVSNIVVGVFGYYLYQAMSAYGYYLAVAFKQIGKLKQALGILFMLMK